MYIMRLRRWRVRANTHLPERLRHPFVLPGWRLTLGAMLWQLGPSRMHPGAGLSHFL
jgi:hypothetical protein